MADDQRLPCTVTVLPLDEGGLDITLVVPTYEEEPAKFTLRAERSKDGDWRVFIPWVDELDDEPALIDGMECHNGILYLGAPEEDEGDTG